MKYALLCFRLSDTSVHVAVWGSVMNALPFKWKLNSCLTCTHIITNNYARTISLCHQVKFIL